MNRWKLILIVAAIPTILVGGCIGYANFLKSEGHRDGYIYKFSKKGMYRTWEGELATPALGGKESNIWYFSVTDPEIIKVIDEIDGSQFVRVYYREYYWRPGWEGDTLYRAIKINPIRKSGKNE